MRTFGFILLGGGIGVATGLVGIPWYVNLAILTAALGLVMVIENPRKISE